MDAEAGYTINGDIYEELSIYDLDTDERFILYEYSKLRQEDFLGRPDETDAQRLERILELAKHPGYWPAIWHCSYRRRHPDLDYAAIRAIVGKLKFFEVMGTIATQGDEEADDGPLALTSEPQPLSERSSLDRPQQTTPSTSPPGDDSTNSSALPDKDQKPITVSRSDTSSISAREISAA